MERKIIRPSYHEHPLILEKHNEWHDGRVESCYGCGKPVADSEMAYVCREPHYDYDFWSPYIILHKKCGELASEIRHSKHPHHPIYLHHYTWSDYQNCDDCGRNLGCELVYRCDSCDFNIDLECKKLGIEVLVEERKELEHPSHPHHPLTLMRKPPFSFHCDGCGAKNVDMAYICSTCDFWVHKSCASLPLLLSTYHHHHHPLSLSFSFPEEHRRKFLYTCDVCDKYIGRTYWVYFCGDCRYFVHIKCIPDYSHNLNEDVIEFPLHENDISDKLITPFVMRQTGLDHIPDAGTSNSSFLFKYPLSLVSEFTHKDHKDEDGEEDEEGDEDGEEDEEGDEDGEEDEEGEYYHEHPLSLVSEFTHKDHKDEDGEEDEEGDEEGELKICDACVTPISSSTPYYECADNDACTYSIHYICSLLPHTLQYSSSSSNLNSLIFLLLGECQEIPNKNHKFKLYKSKGRDGAISSWLCDLCGLPTNGMGYECGDCGMKIDVKCASLPTAIQHASHTRRCHKPLLPTRIPSGDTAWKKSCHGCNLDFSFDRKAYCCSDEGCDFALHMRCALLPLSVTNREWDKHQLLLTSDASREEFFCEFCEEEMHPKNWMYHCRHCDASFHIYCLDTAGSGQYRNMKFGQPYEMDGIDHPNHPLTFTCISLTKRCDACHKKEYVYRYLGFECASCYYVMCRSCGVSKLRKILS